MGMRDEMFRAKVLIFMVPLVLPIGQPPARATNGSLGEVECVPAVDQLTPVILQTQPGALKRTKVSKTQVDRPTVPDTE